MRKWLSCIREGQLASSLGLPQKMTVDYQLERSPRFLAQIAQARQSLREGRGTRLEELPDAFWLEEAEETTEIA